MTAIHPGERDWSDADPSASRAFYRRRRLYTLAGVAFILAAAVLVCVELARAGFDPAQRMMGAAPEALRANGLAYAEALVLVMLVVNVAAHWMLWKCPLCRTDFGRELGWFRRGCDHCKSNFSRP